MSASDQPLVSVLMTTYNREKYLAQAIESVLASTYPNFELIVVDDQSKDRSLEIAQSYAAKDPRVISVLNEKNLGDYPNRNKAASLAKGKYLKYVDADDMIYPHGLEILVRNMEQFPEAGFGLCSLPQDPARLYPFVLSPEEAYRRHYFDKQLFHKAPLSAIIRKDAFEAVGRFSGRRYLGDFEMWHVLAARYPVVLMQQGIVWYRVHEEQEMQHNRTNLSIPFKYLMCAEEMLNKPECPLNESDRRKALDKVKWNQARYILGVGKNHSPKIMRELKKESGMSWPEIFKRVLNKPK
ncbi:MAG: glycosyltransferase family 2 protein [Bacteroidetes bacterium]|nr:glycosyltransferase family 2 protein [Bacteroidota bacterium]